MGIPKFASEPYLISIGNHVTISGDVTFVTHDGATWTFRNQPKYQDVIRYGRIVIHDNCFIGHGALILPGVCIGRNAVVAARAVVTRDVPAGAIVAGNPAKVINSVDQYAQKLLSLVPNYDKTSYHRDKRSELLKLYPYPW